MRNEDFCELICDKFKNLNRLTWMWKNLGNIYDFDVKFRDFYACVTRTIPKSHVDIACNRASPSFGVFHPCLIEYKSLSGKWQCKYTNQRTEIESKFFLPLRRAPGMFFFDKNWIRRVFCAPGRGVNSGFKHARDSGRGRIDADIFQAFRCFSTLQLTDKNRHATKQSLK